jgi:hypothetical protein
MTSGVTLEQLEEVLERKFQNFLNSLNASTTQIQNIVQTEVGSIKKYIKSKQILNEGVKLPTETYYQRVIHNPLVHKILFIMKYVVSTQDGVVVTWPFKLKEQQYIFVTNTHLLKFAAKNMFPRDLNQKDVDDIITELSRCQIETYIFEDQDMDILRTFFSIEPQKKSSAMDKKYKWFGIRAEILKDLFVTLHEDYMKKSQFTSMLKTWTTQGKAQGHVQTQFPDWGLTARSRSQIYPTKSKSAVRNKVQWGISVPQEFVTEDVYEAIGKLQIQRNLPKSGHIGCGWIVLSNKPITHRTYTTFNVAPENKPIKPKQPRRKKARVEKNPLDEPPKTPLDEPPLDTDTVDKGINEHIDHVGDGQDQLVPPPVLGVEFEQVQVPTNSPIITPATPVLQTQEEYDEYISSMMGDQS